MKSIVIKGNLYDGLGVVERAVGENQNLPILKNILLEADQNHIHLTATNLEIAITATISGKTIEPGRTTIPAGMFANIVGNIQTERLNLEEQKNILEIKTDNYEAKIQTLPSDDFPLIPKIKNTKIHLTVRGDVLKEALAQTTICAQFSELRPELSSILFSYSVDQLTLAATDSFRLGQKTIPKQYLSGNATEPFSILVPLKTANELLRIIKTDDPINISLDENQILFSTSGFECISRLIDGTFPEYENLVPKKFQTEVMVSREELLAALKLVSVFSTRVQEVKFKIPKEQKNIELFSLDQTIGENR